MSGGTSTARAINEIEGYLLWEAEKEKVRARARDFSSGMPWLTDSQREEVERHYARDQLEVSRSYLRRIASRSGELRTEYEEVYRFLRRRLIAACLGTVALVVLVATTVAVVLGGG
ncbi:hypothetical protein [Streptomyces sp. NPDC003077]|uniref:hypothetical protein n=1 Tax=Streptomyces sp. NPDC003077 TaxID=3154443 RepID=UPI0033A858C4